VSDEGDARYVGPYRLIEHLGRGGMGEVWLAEDSVGAAGGAPRQVALKLLDDRRLDDPDARARFAREVAAARLVRGPGVAVLLDADVAAPQPWLASAYVAGPTLEQHVSRHGPLSDAPLRALGAALADALVTIHTAGVVHRDLTPRNVVLGPDGPRVVDFGIAWYEGAPAITRTGARVGTPAWMPPERLSGDVITAAGDVWSWGAVMAYAARGRPVVTGSSPEIVAHRILAGEADVGGIPDWLEPWVRAALLPDPAARPGPTELLAAMTAAPSSPVAAAGTDAARQRTEVAHDPPPTQASDADPTRVQAPGRPGIAGPVELPRTARAEGAADAGATVPVGAPPESLPGVEPTLGAGSAGGSAGPAGGRRRVVRWLSAAVILGASVAVGLLAGLLPVIIVTAVLFMAAIGLRLAEQNDPRPPGRTRQARPVPPTWAVGLAGLVVLGVGLMRAFGPAAGAAALVGLVVLFFLLGGDIA
jgi:hypothetical protein